jgi:hypothetical protein
MKVIVVIDVGEPTDDLADGTVEALFQWIRDDLPRWQIVDMQVED